MPPPSSTPPQNGSYRLIALILLAMVVAGVLIGWLAKGGGAGSQAGKAQARPERDRGPAGDLFGKRGSGRGAPPTASDVLGALGAGAASGRLVTVEGHVVDAISRAPVGDVEVVFAGPSGEASATAGADGAYRVEVAVGEYRAFVRGDHVISVGPAPYERLPTPPDPGMMSAPDDRLAPLLTVNASQQGVDLEVQQSGVVVGKVVDRTGRPVVGAVVRAELGPWRPVLGTHLGETGADGGFRLEVPGGFYDLAAAHPDFAGVAQVDQMNPNVTVYPGLETEVVLTLAAGCVITGRAVRPDGSSAGPGALERGNGVDFWPAGTMADDGSFRYTTVREEEVTLRAWPWKAPPAPPASVRCSEGKRAVVEFVVPDRAPDLTGHIVDASGDPTPGAYIDIYGLTPGAMNQQERADADGAWAVFALPPGDYAVTAHVPGQGIARTQVTVPAQDVALQLSGTGSLAGRVDGVADGATFQLEVGGCMSEVGAVVVPATTRVVPAVGGRYRVDGLPACSLMAWARSPVKTTPVQAEIVAGAVAQVDLDLAPPREKTLRVSVIDADGNAVAGAQVTAMSMDGKGGAMPSPVMTDGRGAASLQVHVGDYVSVFHDDPTAGSASMGQHIVSDAPGSVEEIEIRLEPAPTWDP